MYFNTKFKILICDDNADFRKAFKLQLNDVMWGWIECIDEACTGEQAMYMVEQNRYHIAFMDIEMPGYNGIDTAHYINTNHPRLRIVALTMHSEREYMEKMIYAGARHYLIKDRLDDVSITKIFRQVAKTI
ncbi:MAG: response regulator transcription factor [Breznakibacter sp.]